MGSPPDPIQIQRGADNLLFIRLPYTPERITKIRTLPGRRWHAEGRYWSLPLTPETPAALLKLFAGDTVELEEGLTPSLESRVLAFAAVRGLRPRTAAAYAAWARRFREQAGRSASTRNQALHALVFLFEEVLGRPLPRPARSKIPVRVPVVLSREEAGLLLGAMAGLTGLMALLLYGSGLRLRECCAVRVKDIDLREHRIRVQDRAVPLPSSAEAPLRRHLEAVERLHQKDLAQGGGSVEVPADFLEGYPDASRQWGFQWAFPAPARTFHAPSRQWRRCHLHPTALQKAVREARLRAGILKPTLTEPIHP